LGLTPILLLGKILLVSIIHHDWAPRPYRMFIRGYKCL